jgi:hypothetical protein
MKGISQEKRSPGPHINPRPPESEAEVEIEVFPGRDDLDCGFLSYDTVHSGSHRFGEPAALIFIVD